MTPVIQAFRKAGYEVAFDDFGTGYSNLHNLSALNVDILKIDKSFISTLSTNSTSHLIAEHIIEMAQSLHLKTIAEGWKRRNKSNGCLNAAYSIVRAGILRRRCRRRSSCTGYNGRPPY
jgi:sensor c-di-GMP phosphodiesterase-like protein